MEIRHYITATGWDPYQQWLDGLKDLKGRVIIQRRIDRVANENFGDHRFCGDGVWELRIDYGPGYRVYYARAAETVSLLLCGGSKRSQSADIKEAARYWADYHSEKTMKKTLKSVPSRSHEQATVESFRKDPEFAAEYLNSVLEDGDQEELMLALRRMSKAFGGVQKLAGKANLNANTLYRTLSPKGNPELKSLRAVLRAMGMQLTVRPLRKRVA